jgi:hypothetical protein
VTCELARRDLTAGGSLLRQDKAQFAPYARVTFVFMKLT